MDNLTVPRTPLKDEPRGKFPPTQTNLKSAQDHLARFLDGASTKAGYAANTPGRFRESLHRVELDQDLQPIKSKEWSEDGRGNDRNSQYMPDMELPVHTAAPVDLLPHPVPVKVGLTDDDLANLNSLLEHEVADHTKANYRSQWLRFLEWAMTRGVSVLPADPAHIAAYLAERVEIEGHRPSTLRTAAAAIAFIHRAADMHDPCASKEVKRTLSSATRKEGRMQRQAAALTSEALAMIQAAAYEPRPGRGGRMESRGTARRRGHVDVAMISLMRDAMLRVSEASELNWRDITAENDGTGRLLIRRSKTDPNGEGWVAFLSAPTMRMLGAMRGGTSDTDSVFGLSSNQIANRIRKAAQVAGLGAGFSGHSPRVGMAQDLARAGIGLPSLMTAGRWRSPTMPALYTRNETAGRGAVAEYYGCRRPSY